MGTLLHITEKLSQRLLADAILNWQSMNQVYKLQFRQQGKDEAFPPSSKFLISSALPQLQLLLSNHQSVQWVTWEWHAKKDGVAMWIQSNRFDETEWDITPQLPRSSDAELWRLHLLVLIK